MSRKKSKLAKKVWQEKEKIIEVKDKFTGEVIDVVPESTGEDVNDVFHAANEAYHSFKKIAAYERAKILEKTSEHIEKRAEDLAGTICQEAGKAWKYSMGEVRRGAETFKFAAEEAKRIHGETIPMDASKGGVDRVGYYVRTPIGVVAAITPFNFPLNLVAHKVAPAIAAGNTVVLKPATTTPLTAIKLKEIMVDAGLPEGVLNVVVGPGGTIGNMLVSHPKCGKVSFTGSPPVGEQIIKSAGIKKVTLELGNNSGTIIEEDADVDRAVPRCVVSAFANSGQVCISLQRIYVHRKVAETFIGKFLDQTAALKVGNPLDRDCDVGPMIDENDAIRAEQWIGEALSQGAKLLIGGKREGNVLYPTVLGNVDHEMKVMCDETFAPLVSIFVYDEFEEAVRLVDDTPYGLQAGIYTNDIKKAHFAIENIDAGGVMVNDTSIFRVDHMPYGGNKVSGIGREGVRFAIDEMTNVKMVMFNLT